MERFFSYFALSSPERKGYIFLLVCMCLMLCVPWLGTYFETATPSQDSLYAWSAFEEPRDVAQRYPGPSERQGSSLQGGAEKGELFVFNPNNLPESQWLKLGLSKGQIRVIHNYEAKGGVFRKKEDLAKIYVLPTKLYQQLAPYVEIPLESPRDTGSARKYVAKLREDIRPVHIDINKADSLEFQKLRGIGPVFGSRIVRFREALGGFHQKEQLLEVYGVDSALYQQILPFLFLSAEGQILIPINTVKAEDLAKHPYLTRKQANILINYRVAHGDYTSFSDLKKISALDLDILRKIEPYLKF